MQDHLYFQLLSYMAQFSYLIMIALFALATWRLMQSRAIGSRWMLWGILIQAIHLLDIAYRFLIVQRIRSGGIDYPPVDFSFITWLIGSLGLVIFAIGLLLHANHQRGLQARVEELERILDDVQLRGGR